MGKLAQIHVEDVTFLEATIRIESERSRSHTHPNDPRSNTGLEEATVGARQELRS